MPIDDDDSPTGFAASVTGLGTSVTGAGLPSSGRIAPAGVLDPGTVLAGRYRIVALLGRGGMGEVFRADDLTLGQPVALKFLPASVDRDPARLARFVEEVRTARQVSHPNVCRVHDIGECDGRHFLSMEYIDGEDLASLLRRIGRLPSDKAVDIARQLCAGLAAAHDKGVLHRDLKPANVMLDGRGKVRLTDFGLAQSEAAGPGETGLAGTPAYMAPEQFSGQPATVQSDIYALGLVLYEIFSGKRAFDASLISELRRQHEESNPPSLTSAVRDLDPAIERVTLRCLDKNPANRPASALAVSAALPGGDPLAAALAAGETPSPDMVAAAGREGGLRPAVAAAMLVVVAAGLLATALVAGGVNIVNSLPLPYSPDVLSVKSREMLARLGYATPPVDAASGFDWDDGVVSYLPKVKGREPRIKALGSGHLLLEFWYRESPQPLSPERFSDSVARGTDVTPYDPPMTGPGMLQVSTDSFGRLLRLRAVPPEGDTAGGDAMNWQPLLTETGLDPASIAAATPEWLPPVFADSRAAWTGHYRDLPELAVRVEAAAYRGRPVFVRVVRPWQKPRTADSGGLSGSARAAAGLQLAALLICVAGGGMVARRNVLLGRGDYRGALRLAVALGALFGLGWVFGGHHVAALSESGQFMKAVSASLLAGGLTWLLYLALEPHVRRRWPHTLISWSRLLAGRWHDPLVGRDVLVGACSGVALSLIAYGGSLVRMQVDRDGGMPSFTLITPFLGTGPMAGALVQQAFSAAFGTISVFFLLFLLRLALRRDLLAGIAFVAIGILQNVLQSGNPWIAGVMAGLLGALMVVLLFRSGLVAFGVAQFFLEVASQSPIGGGLGTWHGWPSVGPLLVLGALAVYGFRVSMGGKTLLGDFKAEG
jgi:hypothetical protein